MKHEHVVLFDNFGMPSSMVKFTPESGKPLDPVFMVRGREAKAIYISKYENTIDNGVPCSTRFEKAATYIGLDEASKLCRRKGKGWHLMTNAEWEYLHKESISRGTMPHGNTEYGAYFFNKLERGIRYGAGHTLTGSGPVEWTHTHTPDGVCDLCGNHWEMTAGLRLVKGAIEYIKDNDAAVADLAPDSKAWRRAKTAAGQDIFLGPPISGGVTVTAEAQEGFYQSCSLEDLEIKLEEEPEILEQLGIVSPRVEEEKAYIYVNSKNDESMALRGSDFTSVYCGGIGALNFSYPRSYVSNLIGFRSAYVEF